MARKVQPGEWADGPAAGKSRREFNPWKKMTPSNAQDMIYGRNPILETLRASRRAFHSLLVQQALEPSALLDEIFDYAAQLNLPVERRPRQDLDLKVSHHQGLILLCGPYPYLDLFEILEHAQTQPEPPLLLLLDQLQDPQNFGTLLRTAEAVGVHGVLLPDRHSVGVTPAVVSASSGASEHLHIGRTNLAQAMRRLKEDDLWLVGLERGTASQRIDAVDLKGSIGLVVGSEGSGLRPLVRDSCDFLVSIPMRGRLESLNAAVAGSLALYRIWEQRGF